MGRRDLDDRVAKLEKAVGELGLAFNASRSNFLMTVNQMGKVKEYVESHVHTMTDDGGNGETRPQGDVINVIHELVQVLEQESNTLRVDINGLVNSMSRFSLRLDAQERALQRLCEALGRAVDPAHLRLDKDAGGAQ